jgi:hypothetical protein
MQTRRRMMIQTMRAKRVPALRRTRLAVKVGLTRSKLYLKLSIHSSRSAAVVLLDTPSPTVYQRHPSVRAIPLP